MINLREGRGKGYVGNSMSVNAKLAYESGEKAMSNWKKADFVEMVNESLDVSIKRVKGSYKKFLVWSSWHHTSSKFNRTEFYSIDYDLVEKAIADKIIILYTEEELKEIERKEEVLMKEIQAAKENSKNKEQLITQEFLTCEIETSVSKNGNKLFTVIITNEQPNLFKENYIPLKSLIEDNDIKIDARFAKYIKRGI